MQNDLKQSKTGTVLEVELLAIDLSTCERCVPVHETLTQAVNLLRPIAAELGYSLNLVTSLVEIADEARRLALVSSPTIRINGHDIAPQLHESPCSSCGSIAGQDDICCRDWHYRGSVYTSAPLGLLLEAILQAMLNYPAWSPIAISPSTELPANLASFFTHKPNNTVKQAEAQPVQACCSGSQPSAPSSAGCACSSGPAGSGKCC